MIMIVKTPGSQMGSPAAAEEGGEEVEVGGGRVEREVNCKRDGACRKCCVFDLVVQIF